MLVVIGLVLLIAAVVVIVAGAITNSGDTHALAEDFDVLGFHVSGSAGELFLYGAGVGAVAMLGLALLVAGMRHARRRTTVRAEAP